MTQNTETQNISQKSMQLILCEQVQLDQSFNQSINNEKKFCVLKKWQWNHSPLTSMDNVQGPQAARDSWVFVSNFFLLGKFGILQTKVTQICIFKI